MDKEFKEFKEFVESIPKVMEEISIEAFKDFDGSNESFWQCSTKLGAGIDKYFYGNK